MATTKKLPRDATGWDAAGGARDVTGSASPRIVKHHHPPRPEQGSGHACTQINPRQFSLLRGGTNFRGLAPRGICPVFAPCPALCSPAGTSAVTANAAAHDPGARGPAAPTGDAPDSRAAMGGGRESRPRPMRVLGGNT